MPTTELPMLEDAIENLDLSALGPATLTFTNANRLIPPDDLYVEARAFYEGDHWQGGDAWIGPVPDPDGDFGDLVDDIEHILVPHPGTEDIVNRARDAISANEPRWSVTVRRALADDESPTTQEQTDIDVAEALLTDFWDGQEVLEEIQKVVEDICLGGRGIMRIVVPVGELIVGPNGEVRVPDGPVDEQIRRIFPVFARCDRAVVARDRHTMRQVGIYAYALTDPLTGATRNFAEMTYLDDLGRTVIRTVGREGDTDLEGNVLPGEWTADLGRRLMMFEARSRRIVTRPVLQNQKLANVGCTCLGINAAAGGFLERVILNGQVPGHWEDLPAGGRKYIEDEYVTGHLTTNWIEGKTKGNAEDGTLQLATPDIKWREPVRTTTFEKTIAVAHMNILAAARQVHALISGDATASGESRKQAREDFLKSLTRTKSRVDAMGRWLLETSLKLAATFAKTPNKYDAYRVVFECSLDIGPASAEDRKANLLEVAAEVRSRENCMLASQVTNDTEAEKGIIRSERAEFGPAQVPANLGGDNPPPATTLPNQLPATSGGTGSAGA